MIVVILKEVCKGLLCFFYLFRDCEIILGKRFDYFDTCHDFNFAHAMHFIACAFVM